MKRVFICLIAYDLYSELLAHFIRDVRKDLGAPSMPFVIGVMGVGGVKEEPDYFRQAMAAPASLPDFKGNRGCGNGTVLGQASGGPRR